jgi:putative transposase
MRAMKNTNSLTKETQQRHRRNKIVVTLHFVWATHQRLPLVTDALETPLYRCIQAEAKALGCEVLAVGGMPDHVHLIVAFHTTVSISKLMQQVKGVSSSVASDLLDHQSFFGWDDGYAVFSLSPLHRETAIAYVKRQKEHHANQKVWDGWEETGVEFIPPTGRGRQEAQAPRSRSATTE